ncbi:MAG: ABC transporter permease [Candidatus Aminicenantes bacterium]
MWIRFLAKRSAQTILVLMGVSFIIFSFLHLTPGDPVELMMGEAAGVSQQEVEQLRHQYGLDRPFPVQYFYFITRAVQGDLGLSFTHQRPVTEVIGDYLPATVELTFTAMFLALLVAIPLGMISAMRPHGILDHGASWSALLGISMPGFLIGVLLILIFGMRLEWLPVSGRIDYGISLKTITGCYVLDSMITLNGAALLSALRHLLLPAVALGGWTAAVTMRMTRASMLEMLQQDYILFARAKGLPERVVALNHALKNAMIPVISVVGLQLGSLLGGNMIIETVFGWPGLGRMTVDAIYARNYPLVQGAVLLYAVTYVVINFATDMLYTYLNPRIENV